MVTHTQQQVATGAWVEQAGTMTVSLISILCGDGSPLWGRNKGCVFFKSLDTETNVLFVTVTVQQIQSGHIMKPFISLGNINWASSYSSLPSWRSEQIKIALKWMGSLAGGVLTDTFKMGWLPQFWKPSELFFFLNHRHAYLWTKQKISLLKHIIYTIEGGKQTRYNIARQVLFEIECWIQSIVVLRNFEVICWNFRDQGDKSIYIHHVDF